MEKLPGTKDMAEIAKRSSLLAECKEKVIAVLKQNIRPEFLNRIDETIMFEPLTTDDIREIVRIQMAELKAKLSAEGIEISFTKAFENLMTEKGYDPAYGARPVKRLMQRELINQMATALLSGTIKRDSVVEVDAAGGQVLIRNKNA